MIGSLVICFAIFELYSVAFGHNFLFDEQSIILGNPFIRYLSRIPDLFMLPYFYDGLGKTLWHQYYRPLTTVTFALDFHFWQMNPLGYNLTNTLLQCGVCVLLFKLLLMMFEDVLAAFLAALLYAVHPIHTEAVTYIASRGDLLGTLLVLSALFFYWRSQRGWALVMHALSLFAKESAILCPVYLLTLDIAFIKSDWKALWKRLTPFVVLTVVYLIFRKFICPVPMGPPDNHFREAALRVLSMGPPFLSYLQTLVMPPVFTYSLTVTFSKSFADPRIFTSVCIIFLMLAGWFLAMRHRGAAFFGMSVFLISFLPYLQVIHFYPEWAEHYLYVPAIGLTVLVGGLIKNILHVKNWKTLLVFFILYFSCVSALGYRTWNRNKIYNDEQTYYDYLSKTDARYAYFGYEHKGFLALERGDADNAYVPIKTALLIEPTSDATHNLLGMYYLTKGKLEPALEHFDLAYKYSEANPIYLINASHVLIRLGRYPRAIEKLDKAQNLAPNYSSVYINLMTAYELMGNNLKAEQWAEKGLHLTKKNEWEEVTLMMAAVRLAYREGRYDLARERLSEIEAKHSKVFWFSDIARVVLGKMTVDEFKELAKTSYFGFGNAMDEYVLMALIMRQRWDEAETVLEKNREIFGKKASKQPLFRKELEQAKAAILRSR